MALISLRNFVEPFQNKVHLITILLVVIAFAVFRFSGGGIKISSASKPSLNSQKADIYRDEAPPINLPAVKPSKQADDEFEF